MTRARAVELATVGVWVMCVPALADPPAWAQQLPPSSPPHAMIATLIANPLNAVRTVVLADETTGVDQLRDLAGWTQFEEQWAFVPQAGLWTELGRGEASIAGGPQVEMDIEYLRALVDAFGSVHVVHVHPASAYRHGAWAKRVLPLDYRVATLEAADLQQVGFALPSPADIWSSIQITETIIGAFPEASIRHAVVSPHGVVSYGPTAVGSRRLLHNIGNPRVTLNRDLVIRVALRRGEHNIARTADLLGDVTIGALISALCEQASDDNYALTFKPH